MSNLSDNGVYRLGQILSIEAEIEAMKVANRIREDQQLAPAYGENDFFAVSQTLQSLIRNF